MASNKNIDELFDQAETQVAKELSLQNLTIPDKQVDGQKFVLIQLVEDSKGNQILKVWGAFATQEEADAQAEQIKGKFGNELFDLFVLEMYGLAKRPPNRSEISGQKYNNQDLQLLVDTKAEQKKKINERFDMRDQALENESEELHQRQNELKNLLEPISEESVVVPEEPKPKEPTEFKPAVQTQNNELVQELAVKQDAPPTHFDPDDDLQKTEELECLKTAKDIVNEEFDSEEFCKLILAKEDIRVDNQNWALVSFTGKGCKQRTDDDGIIFWGIFDKIDNYLKRHAQSLKESNMDIHVLELYTWVAIPPSLEYMKSVETHEKHLLEVLKRHKLVYQFDKERFNFRKNKLQNNPDMNQYRRSKEVFKQLLEKFGAGVIEDNLTLTTETSGVQNKELFDRVFPKSKPLPKFEVVDESNLEK